MKRYCLIIDNDPDLVAYKNYERNVKSKTGIDLEIISFNPNVSEFQKETKDDIVIDISKLRTKLQELLKRRIDLIACDFYLDDKVINGLEVIKIIRHEKSKAKIFLFSGLIKDIINGVIGDYDITKDRTKLFSNIKTLIKSGITDFIERENSQIENAIIQNLKTTSWDIEIDQVFNENQHIEFKSGFPPFRGKTLNEIKNEIDNDTIKSQEFKNEILNLVISQIVGADE